MTLPVSRVERGPEVGKDVDLTRLPPTDWRSWKTVQLVSGFFKQPCAVFQKKKKKVNAFGKLTCIVVIAF